MDVYDEVIEVENGREIQSPLDSSSLREREAVPGAGLPPTTTRRSAQHEFSEEKAFRKLNSRSVSPDSSESSSREVSRKADSMALEEVDAPHDVKDLMQYISRYTPQRVPIEYKLRIFIPDYIPAVGDIDAFLKVTPPDPLRAESEKPVQKFTDSLGTLVVDEPCGQQSDQVLLQMKLRSIFPKPFETPSAVAHSAKDIDRWISEIQFINSSQMTPQTALQMHQMPEIDAIMSEWPEPVEKLLDSVGIPSPNLDCSLPEYIRTVTSLFDIPIGDPQSQVAHISALYTLFSLYIAIKGDVN